MTKRRPRGLRPEEQDLWKSVTAGVRPHFPERRPPPDAPSGDATRAPSPEEPSPLPTFRVGAKAGHGKGSVAITPAAKPWGGAPKMDAKTFGKMKRGQVRPDARIDLHGMTVDEAHGALVRFVLSCQARGDRLVLVITGKGGAGGPAPLERGVLRRQVPHWLTLPPLGGAVLDLSPAHRRHGGEGAYYVYLKRLR